MQPQDPALQPLWNILDTNWGAPPAVNQDGYALANDDDEDGGSGGGMASAGECEPEESPAALADAAESSAPIMTEESQPLTPTVLEDSQVVAETTLDSPTVPEMDGLELELDYFDQDSQPRNDIGFTSLASPTESRAASPSDARSDTASDSCGHTGASSSKDTTEILKKIQQARWRLLPRIVFGLGSKVNSCCNHSLAYHCLSREPLRPCGMGYPSFGPPIVPNH